MIWTILRWLAELAEVLVFWSLVAVLLAAVLVGWMRNRRIQQERREQLDRFFEWHGWALKQREPWVQARRIGDRP